MRAVPRARPARSLELRLLLRLAAHLRGAGAAAKPRGTVRVTGGAGGFEIVERVLKEMREGGFLWGEVALMRGEVKWQR